MFFFHGHVMAPYGDSTLSLWHQSLHGVNSTPWKFMSSRCHHWRMTEKQYPSDKQDKFMLRFPAGMRDRIRQEAEGNGRSMNAEIIARLDSSLATSTFDNSELPAAEELARASEFSLKEVREAVWSEVVKQIVYESRFGRRKCVIRLNQIEALNPDSCTHAEILSFVTERLDEKGYAVKRPSMSELEVRW